MKDNAGQSTALEPLDRGPGVVSIKIKMIIIINNSNNNVKHLGKIMEGPVRPDWIEGSGFGALSITTRERK